MNRLIPLLIAAPLATAVSAQRPVGAPAPTVMPTQAPRPPVESALDWFQITPQAALPKPKPGGGSPR